MARGRPKGPHFNKHTIRVKVWEALKSQGRTLPIELVDGKSRLIRGDHSVKVAVADIAKELKCSETTVWNAWAGFDPLSYEWGREKYQHDFEMDMAHEYRREEALRSLQREFGNKADLPTKKLRNEPRDWTRTTGPTTIFNHYK